MAVQKEERFEMSIDGHEPKSLQSQSSSLIEERPRYDSHQYDQTTSSRGPSRVSTFRWPQGISEKKLIRKIDWSIIPILMAAYFLQFLDKVVYNVSYSHIHSVTPVLTNHSTQMSWECKRTSRCTATNSRGGPQRSSYPTQSLNYHKVLSISLIPLANTNNPPRYPHSEIPRNQSFGRKHPMLGHRSVRNRRRQNTDPNDSCSRSPRRLRIRNHTRLDYDNLSLVQTQRSSSPIRTLVLWNGLRSNHRRCYFLRRPKT